MSNIAVQRDSNQPSVAARYAGRHWDPFRAMRELIQWHPLGELSSSFHGLETAAFSANFEVKERKDAFVFHADVPGVKEADLDVRFTHNRLTVSGKRESEKSEKGDTFYTSERSYGSFTRSFTLPDGIDADQIKADLKEGVLTLTVPKRADAQAKKVAVTSR